MSNLRKINKTGKSQIDMVEKEVVLRKVRKQLYKIFLVVKHSRKK